MKAQLLTAIRKKVNIVILALFAVAFLVSLWLMLRPKEEYRFEGSFTPAPGVVLREAPIYEDISLQPGVYQVELSYETENPMGYLCTAKDETVYRGGLLTNGENLYGGKGKTGYLMWLWEPTDRLDICLSYEGDIPLTTGDLMIRETGYLGSMLFVAVLSTFLMYLAVLLYRSYNQAGRISVDQKKAIFGVAVISLIASIPFLLGVSLNGADLTFHLHRIEGIADGMRSGQFPVRIEPEWVHGHGYACGIFYCNLLLYIPAFFRIFGFPVTFCYNIYSVMISTATVIVAYGVFHRIFKNRNIGLACAGLYVLSGMRIYKGVATGAVGEGNAMVFLPLILYGFYLIFSKETTDEQRKNAWIPLSLGYAGVVQTHVLTFEITVFLSLLICLLFIRKVVRKENFTLLVKSVVLTIVLCAWFIVPFCDYFLMEDVHIKHVSGRTIQMMGLPPLQLIFGREISGGEVYLTLEGIGFVLVASTLVVHGLWIGARWRKKAGDIANIAKLSAILGILLMVLSLNVFPWDAIQNTNPIVASLVSSLQFPNRFLGWGTLFCVVSMGCCLWYMEKTNNKNGYLILLAGVLISISAFSLCRIDFICRNQGSFTIYNKEGMGMGYISGAEYVIEGTVDTELMYRGPGYSENVVISDYAKGNLRAEFTCVNTGDEAGFVDVPLLLYRGYRAQNPATGETLDLFYGENNTVCVEIPTGYNGQVLVRHQPLWYWRLGEAVTLLGYGGWLWGRYRSKYMEKRKGKETKA